MTLEKAEAVNFIQFGSGISYSLRRIRWISDNIPGWRNDLSVIYDPDPEDITIAVPYNEHGTKGNLGRIQAEGTVEIAFRYHNYYKYYLVKRSYPSETAPDRFWTFELVKNRLNQLLNPASHQTHSFRGRWSATQRPNDSGLTFAVESDSMVPSRSFRLPCLPKYASSDGTEHQLVYVKISSSEYVGTDQHGNVFRFENYPSTYSFLASSDMFQSVHFGPNDKFYPSITEIIGNIDDLGRDASGNKIGLTPSSIIDISLSERSPVKVNDDLTLEDAGHLLILTQYEHGKAMYARTRFDSSDRSETMSVPQLTDMEKYTGTAELRTSNDDMMASIPVQVLSGQQVAVRSISDVTGLYTEITINGSHMMMPEGKLPYIGSAWSEYAIAQRSYDRENMTLAITNAKSEAAQNTMMGIANGVLTGGLIGGPLGAVGGVASAGLNVAGTALELQRNERTARAQQDMREKMIMSSVGTAYNTGYGMEYLRKADEGRGRFQLNRPQHLTQARYDAYVQDHGYPDSGIEHYLDLSEPGYYCGYLTDSTIFTKYELDAINKELTQGWRVIS